MADKLNIHELYQIQQRKIHLKQQIYETILKRIHHQIRTVSFRGETNLIYKIPTFLIGVPTYNPIHCIEYIIQRLQGEGFVIQYNHPNTIIMDWKWTTPSSSSSTTTGFPPPLPPSTTTTTTTTTTPNTKLSYHPTGRLFH